MKFFNDEWELFLQNCGFTDDELEVIPFLRRGWALIDVSEELSISLSTTARRKKRIMEKIARYISKSIY